MANEGLLRFTQTVETLQKAIRRIKGTYAPRFGIKEIHLVWMCELLKHPDGLTSSRLAKEVKVDRSLVSREIVGLKEDGYLEEIAAPGKGHYNLTIRLTEKGKAVAAQIRDEAQEIETLAALGLTEEELSSFYATAEKLVQNLSDVGSERAGGKDK